MLFIPNPYSGKIFQMRYVHCETLIQSQSADPRMMTWQEMRGPEPFFLSLGAIIVHFMNCILFQWQSL